MSGTRVHAPTPAIGDIIAGRKNGRHKRTFQPVRRNSYNRGERERRYWRPVDPLHLEATLEAAKMHDLIGKRDGKRNGPLGHIGLQVLEQLMRLVNWKDGTLEPAIDTIARKIRRARSAVVRALKRLKVEGFLDWMRRSEPIEDAEGAGPRVRQVSNAYRIETPAKWAARIAQRVAQWRLRRRRGKGAPNSAEPPAPQDPGLAASLARFEAALARRDANPPKVQNPGTE